MPFPTGNCTLHSRNDKESPREEGTEVYIQLVHKHSSEIPQLFKMKDNISIKKMLETFVRTKGIPVSSLELSYGDVRVFPGDTLWCLGIEGRGTIARNP
jgi:hypothetical protein